MTTKSSLREIVLIDEDKCTGCGDCIPSCAEGALQIIDGKAKLVADNLCDGLGACLGTCPEDAIRIVEREADEFDDEEVEKHLDHSENHSHHDQNRHNAAMKEHMQAHATGGCPGARMMDLQEETKPEQAGGPRERQASQLSHWPIKLILLPPEAPFLRGKELLLAADCVGVAHPEMHSELLKGKAIAIACPKFDDTEFYIERMTEIVKHSGITGITVAHMEVPCCHGLNQIAEQAVKNAESDIPVKSIMIGIRGDQQN